MAREMFPGFIDPEEGYLVLEYYESGRKGVRTVASLEEAAELKRNATSGMSSLIDVKIFARLP